MCMSYHMYVYLCVTYTQSTSRLAEDRYPGTEDTEVVVYHCECVLRIEPGFSARAASALNCPAISPAPDKGIS